MKILFASSEAAPYAKSGGLGDVSGALPEALTKIKDNEVCVILPYYASIKNNPAVEAEYVGRIYVPLAWRRVYAGVFKKVIKSKGVGKNKRCDLVYYFIDNDYYFGRPSFYGYIDDGERFAFFSKAVLECLPLVGFTPDIIHANDWQTGFIPLFLKAHYFSLPMYQNIRTVFSIHNIEYQGKADPQFLTDVLGVDEVFRNVCTFDGLINAMKTAIVLCDRLTTVSETYSHEIRYPYFGKGLSQIISENSYKLTGIVNGIDTKVFNPQTDPHLTQNYSPAHPQGKAKCKEELQRELGLTQNPDIPLFAMVSRLVEHKGLELVEGVMEELCRENLQLVILGTGDKRYEDMFRHAHYLNPGKVNACICFDGALASRVYSGADFLIMPSKFEPCGLSQLIAMRYGTIPIVRETGGLVDTVPPLNPETLDGLGITFKVFNAHDMLDAVRRGVSFFTQREKSDKFRQKLMRQDFGWKNSAQSYMQVYTSAIN